jgi:glutaredoxin
MLLKLIHQIKGRLCPAAPDTEEHKRRQSMVWETETGMDASLPHGGVVLYCTSWCPDCRRARAWLKEHEISYTEVDIGSNPKAAKQVRAWANGNETTPTFEIDGTIIINFDEMKLRYALNIK